MSQKKIHRFFVNFQGQNGLLHVNDVNVAHQIARVLKLKPKEMICLVFDGQDVLVELVGVKSSEITGKEISRTVSRMPQAKLTVALAMIRKEQFEWAIEKLTELGVAKIQPMITERTVRLGEKLERWRAIAKEAAELAGWGFVPEISSPKTFSELANSFSEAVFFDANGAGLKSKSTLMFIGPEGGWTEEERNRAKLCKYQIATLGEQTLRAETAAILGAYELLK